MSTALIAGGSGLVGGFLLRQLLAAPEYDRVIAVGRRLLGWSHPKLVQIQVDFAALDKVSADLRCDAAFCCLGTTIKQAGSPAAFRAVDHVAVLALAWVARRHGAEKFYFVSSMGADAGSRIFYSRVKGETERALAVLDFKTLGVFRPSLLLGPRLEKRPGERIGAAVLRLAAPMLLGRLRRYRAIEAGVVARAMLRCSLESKTRGVRVYQSDEIQELGGLVS